jgi:hypothetical protein
MPHQDKDVPARAVTSQFTHPLARAARVWRAERLDGSERRVLVIVTTMELDPKSHRYDERLVERLARAANRYLARSSEATAFVLMNRPKDWYARRKEVPSKLERLPAQ